MSTRCNVIINSAESKTRVILYHHCDGYPEGVGADLKKVYNSLTDYAKQDCEMIANRLVKDQYDLKDDGYEFTTDIHGDIEYLYVIDCSKKTLRCYKAGWDESYKQIVKSKNEVEIPD